jgi:hypothetical protein
MAGKSRADRGWSESPSANPTNRMDLLFYICVERIHRIVRTQDMDSINPDPV